VDQQSCALCAGCGPIEEMNVELDPYVVPQETIIQDPTTQDAAVVSVFQAKIPEDTNSPSGALVIRKGLRVREG
jgi:ribulose 1,5-bisphosphate synthetase/thiazole synthase